MTSVLSDLPFSTVILAGLLEGWLALLTGSEGAAPNCHKYSLGACLMYVSVCVCAYACRYAYIHAYI